MCVCVCVHVNEPHLFAEGLHDVWVLEDVAEKAHHDVADGHGASEQVLYDVQDCLPVPLFALVLSLKGRGKWLFRRRKTFVGRRSRDHTISQGRGKELLMWKMKIKSQILKGRDAPESPN